METPETPEQTELQPEDESTLREYFVTIVVCTIFALFVTTYVVHPMTVPTPSMDREYLWARDAADSPISRDSLRKGSARL